MNSAFRVLAFIGLAAGFGALLSCGGGGGGGSGSGSGTSNSSLASNLPSCGSSNALFSVPPIALSQISGWEPLGHVNPPGHTFPTDHQYLYFIDPNLHQPAPPLPVLAPANIRVLQLYRSTAPGTGANDYSVFFATCSDVLNRFGHLSSLDGPLASQTGNINMRCNTYEPSPGSPVTQCESDALSIDVPAGTQIGTSAGGGSFALDWWVQDRRLPAITFASASRFASNGGFDTAHTTAASEYFVASMAAQIAPKIGRFDGAIRRTVLPLGGSIAIDASGSARGYWFNPAQAYPPESYHAALAPDYVEPDRMQTFSLGVSQTGAGPLIQNFLPATSGTVNRAFESVTADGNVYCYQGNPALFYGGGDKIILLQMPTPTSLRLEVRSGVTTCAAASPYAFGANAVSYVR